jgi:hypothetical protein
VLAVGLLAGCSGEAGGAPGSLPGPSGDSDVAVPELEPTKSTYLWQEDLLSGDTQQLSTLLDEGDPVLLRTQAEWDAWWDEVPEELASAALSTPSPDLDGAVAVVASYGSCPPTPIRFTAPGEGEIGHEYAQNDADYDCAWNPRAVYVFTFTLESLGVDSADEVSLSD